MAPIQPGARLRWKRWWSLLVARLLLWSSNVVVVVRAQDPIYRTISASQKPPHAPWRSYYVEQRHRLGPHHFTDYSRKFMDLNEVRKDRRARVFSADIYGRRPNQFSMTTRLVWFTIFTFALQVWKPSITPMGWKISDRILRGEQLYRTVTPIFLHGGLLHLGMNMISLRRIGNDVERLFGPGRYLATYLAAGICGNLLSALQSPNPSLGASGSVFGIAGAYFVFLNRNDWILGEAGQAITNSIGQTMLTNAMLGFFVPQIDQWGHLGGALGGGLMAYAFGPRLYLTEIPTGSDDDMSRPQRVVIDRPIVRTPEYLETSVKKLDCSMQRIAGFFDTHILRRVMPSGGDQPWQVTPGRSKSFLPRQAPNRSIKPGPVD
jgi:membrane associated rhomboid family serine protease